MISFIVIGKNEGWKLTNCFESIYDTIEYNDLKSTEIIYVDSKSTDDSLGRVKEFRGVRIFEITGECNAAIARNVGAKEAIGDILFFIDGDMEIEQKFLSKVLDTEGNLKYDCLTGHLDDVFYDYQDNFLGKSPRTYKKTIPDTEEVVIMCGGIFLINKPIWEKVHGMNTKYERSQDRELILRMARVGVQTVRVPYLIATHHMVDYHHEDRMWNHLKARKYSALITREYLFNTGLVLKMMRENYTPLFLALTLSCLLVSINIATGAVFLYVLLVLARVSANTIKAKTDKNKLIYLFERIIYQVTSDINYLFAFLFFFPSSKELQYQKVS